MPLTLGYLYDLGLKLMYALAYLLMSVANAARLDPVHDDWRLAQELSSTLSSVGSASTEGQ